MAVLSMAIALSGLSIFHYRLIYIGMTTDAYISSRNARGPDIWSINTAEYKKKMEEARKYQVAYHEPLSIVSIDKGDAVEIK